MSFVAFQIMKISAPGPIGGFGKPVRDSIWRFYYPPRQDFSRFQPTSPTLGVLPHALCCPHDRAWIWHGRTHHGCGRDMFSILKYPCIMHHSSCILSSHKHWNCWNSNFSNNLKIVNSLHGGLHEKFVPKIQRPTLPQDCTQETICKIT